VDFKNITQEQMDVAKAKFISANASVKLAGGYGRTANWADLCNPEMVTLSDLKNSMRQYGTSIKLRLEDELLGDANYSHSTSTARGKRVVFTHEDCYLFLRSALKERMESEAYLKNRKKAEELQNFIEANKSQDEKLAEAKLQLEVLTKLLDE